MPGGLPELFGTIIGWGSLILLGVAVFLFMPRSWTMWLRSVLALIQMGVGYTIITFGWLFYVLRNGIDTL
jgi:hypothetical protein